MTTPEENVVPKRVLIAEDVEAIAELMSRILTQEGMEVAVVHDGEQCLRRLGSFRPDLVILDLLMPKVHGIDVLKKIKADEQTRSIPVVVLTAKDFRTEVARIRELGAAGLIVKPFDPKALLQKVQDIFASESQTTEIRRGSSPAIPRLDAAYLPEANRGRGHLKLWGTRGSIPVSGPQYVRHGGNTTCMTVEKDDEILILDAGSGIRELGLALAAGRPRRLHLLITHTHWDHIQGFPFFAPAFIPGFEIVVYGARGFTKNLESLLRGQLDPDYFPIQMEDMDARLEFVYLDQPPMTIGGFTVSWEFTQHPGATVGYRIETGGKSVAFVPDNEIFQGYLGPPADILADRDLLTLYRPILDFLAGVDVLIHEAQYTAEEYQNTVRFGHSSVSNACALAKLVRSPRWLIVHHDPNHSDELLQAKLRLTRQILAELDHPVEVENAYDGQVVMF